MKMKKITTLVLLITLFSFTFTFNSCKEEAGDFCEDVNCLNGGTCSQGTCNCTERYTGSRCQNQKTPTSIKIPVVEIPKWPYKNNGQDWDENDGPDLSISVLKKGISEIYTTVQPIMNVFPGNLYEFNTFPVLTIKDVTSSYTLRLLDIDNWSPAIMGELDFVLYEDGNGFPTTMLIDDGGDISFKIHLVYYFD